MLCQARQKASSPLKRKKTGFLSWEVNIIYIIGDNKPRVIEATGQGAGVAGGNGKGIYV